MAVWLPLRDKQRLRTSPLHGQLRGEQIADLTIKWYIVALIVYSAFSEAHSDK